MYYKKLTWVYVIEVSKGTTKLEFYSSFLLDKQVINSKVELNNNM
ncbi:hypothetical protein [Clostridium tetani]|nr:hypothetical protein [Clostridium tetani]